MTNLNIEELNEKILQNNNVSEVKDIVSRLSSYPSYLANKPLLLFHLCGWLYGGAERLLTNLLNSFSKKYRIVLAVFEPVKNTTFKLDESIVFIKICGNTELRDRLFQLIMFFKPDIFIGNNNSLPEIFSIYPKLKEKNIKTIAYSLEYFFFIHNNKILSEFAIERNKCLRSASVSVFLTNFSTTACSSMNDKVMTIPPPNTFQKQECISFKKGGKTILSVGRFNDPIKRVDKILKVYKKVLQSEPDAKLVLAGPYDLELKIYENHEETISDLIEKLELKDTGLRFAGLQEEIAPIYKEADLLLITSDNEGFPMVLTEAAVFGLPLLAFEIPGLEDIIESGKNGFLVEKNNIDKMAEKIILLLANDKLRKDFAENSQKLAERFNIENVGKIWENLINAIISNQLDTYLQKNKPKIDDIKSFSKLFCQEYENHASFFIKKSQLQHQEMNYLNNELIRQIENNSRLQAETIRLQEEIKRLTFPKFLQIVVIPLYLIRDLFKSFKEDSFSVTCNKILKKLRLKKNG